MRPLRPGEVAGRDQALAAATDEAATTGHVVLFVDSAPADTRCSMCDCGSSDPGSHDETWCAGCPRDADSIFRMFMNTPYETAAAVCSHHRGAAEEILGASIRRSFPDAEFVIARESGWLDPE